LLEPKDEIMADRGVAIEGEFASGMSLKIPPFSHNQPQLSEQDEVTTRRIAKHPIERAIQRIKSYILHSTSDLNFSMAVDLNRIWIICSYLTLFDKPLLT
jgi:hypothetical protein